MAPRPVLWVLATKTEADEFITPHMVNGNHYWREVRKKPAQELETSWMWGEEFCFFVPVPTRLTDAPTVMFRIFPYSGLQTMKPWPVGGQGDPTPVGRVISDIETQTLERFIQDLKGEGLWEAENR